MSQTSELLRASILGQPQKQSDEIIALAVRLEHCESKRNVFILDRFEMRAWRCRSKLCDHCLSYASALQRQKLRAIIRDLKIPTGSNLQFITLTVKNPSASIVVTRAIMERTWRLFTKRSLFADLFRGGSKTEEFTITPTGFHFHIHLLTIARYIHFQELRRVWTECFHQATKNTVIVNTKDGNLLVKVIKVSDTKKAIFEVTKYVTKTWSFGRLSWSALRELALMERWNRQFEVFGDWRCNVESKPILDKENLSAGSVRKNVTWRDHLHKIGLPLYLNHLENEVRDRQRFFELQVLPTLSRRTAFEPSG